ncbi:DNA starvation/stationary phase protection protein [Cryomorphaceae bacterium 1068]|jgi:starvation-inducible DNA-binding protein|nr:DNA starvation/stationary phase protection protein [Cryomorphaceae bacterium 1068]
METKAKEKSFIKLGFDKDEAYEVVETLNALLANYAVLYQKIRNFHWNVTGGDFFDIHEKLEEEYTAAAEYIDSVAERIRILGFKPLSTLSAYIEKSDIEETEEDLSGAQMMEIIVEDYETLLSFMVDAADAAIEHGDIGTETLMREILSRTEEKHWMFTAFIKKG